jgi:Fe-S oxidoreductase
MDHCTACGKCTAVCPVKIHTSDVTLHMRAYLDEKGAGGHPFKTQILKLLSKNPQKTLPLAAQAASLGQSVQNKMVDRIPASWKQHLLNPMFTGKGPELDSSNIAKKMGLKKGAIFLPENDPQSSLETVFYFPGCGAGLFYPSIAMAGTYLLLKAGIGVALPPEHLCCGYPLLAAGHNGAYRKMGRENQEIIQASMTRLDEMGHSCTSFLTSCGTCREGTAEYRLNPGAGRQLDHLDAAQFIMERLHCPSPPQEECELVYHAACHPEWTGMDPAKAGGIYAKALETESGCTVRLSPGCCGESGMGAMTSPAIYNKIRAKKQEQLNQDLKAYPDNGPIIVGCPSCKIGIKRSLIQMHRDNEVLHTLEYLAERHGGKDWKKDFLKTLAKAKVVSGARVVKR